EIEGTRWSYKRDFGRTRLVVIDSRCGRVLEGERREMVDDDEWAWIEEQAAGDFDHLLLATSLPFALAPAIHDLEAWNEAVTAGAWGRLAAGAGERIRQGIDLEHWAAFNDSFDRLAALIEAVAAGRRGRAPGSVVVLSGDVHHTYLAELSFPGAGDGHSPAWQAVCSPLRNPLPRDQRAAHRRAFPPPAPGAARWRRRERGACPAGAGSSPRRSPGGWWRAPGSRTTWASWSWTAARPGSGSSRPSPPTAATAPPALSSSTRADSPMAEGELTYLARWPVKSLRGEALTAARLDWRGLGGDRAYALLDEREGREGRWVTIRQAPRMLAWS